MNIPRILIGAGASGSGKTLITCGILAALQERGLNVASFKCGPDYIDPMFHSQVLGTRSRNLDTFFTGEKVTRALLEQNARDADIAVMEGVMGFYDGVGGTTTQASAYELSRMTRTPERLHRGLYEGLPGIQGRQPDPGGDLEPVIAHALPADEGAFGKRAASGSLRVCAEGG